jgi:alpha-N-acetylglucosaminidase
MRKPIVEAIPKDRILMLDLNSSKWKGSDAFWGRPWVAGLIHNFGGGTFMGGDLPYYAANAPSLLHNPAAGNLTGIGLFPEAIEQNPVVYELGSELAWWREAPVLDDWIRDYAEARYGSLPPKAAEAWQILQQTVYGQKRSVTPMESPVCATPALDITQASPNGGMERDYDQAALWDAWNDLLAAGADLKNVQTYQYDLVDVARQCLSDLSIALQNQITKAYRAKDTAELQKASDRFLSLIDDMDELLGTRREFLLGKWISGARAWGKTMQEKDLYEKNARMLITTWGPVRGDAVQYDYSNRQWSGLLKGYYKQRWEQFLHYLQQQPLDSSRFTQKNLPMSYGRPSYVANDFYKGLAVWERAWTEGNEKFTDIPSGSSFEVAKRLYEKWHR